MCDVVEQALPEVVSFHFGLPQDDLYDRVRALGRRVLCSATTVEEAVFLESKGVDAIIAQGVEAGGHRGMFLEKDISNQPGTLALVPQIVDAVSVPVIAAGGIGDSRGIAACFALGASCVQIGSLFLFCREALTARLHLEALSRATDNNTVLTNLFTGRPARGIINYLIREIGPMNSSALPFPLAGDALAALKADAQIQVEQRLHCIVGRSGCLHGQTVPGAVGNRCGQKADRTVIFVRTGIRRRSAADQHRNHVRHTTGEFTFQREGKHSHYRIAE